MSTSCSAYGDCRSRIQVRDQAHAKHAWREGRMGHAELVVTRFPDTNRGLPRIVELCVSAYRDQIS